MEPGFLQERLSRGDRPNDKAFGARTVTWLCLPYFCLEEYAGVLSASRPGSHPMRTLLQARFSLVRKERDLQHPLKAVAALFLQITRRYVYRPALVVAALQVILGMQCGNVFMDGGDGGEFHATSDFLIAGAEAVFHLIGGNEIQHFLLPASEGHLPIS